MHLLNLENAGLSISGKNVLAFSSSLDWNIERVKGGSIATGGLFNTTLRGTGWVALTTDGPPVVLNAAEAPTFADTNAVVAWSANLQTQLKTSFKAGALIGRGSGEAVQVSFYGQGFVIVQPSEGIQVAGPVTAAGLPGLRRPRPVQLGVVLDAFEPATARVRPFEALGITDGVPRRRADEYGARPRRGGHTARPVDRTAEPVAGAAHRLTERHPDPQPRKVGVSLGGAGQLEHRVQQRNRLGAVPASPHRRSS